MSLLFSHCSPSSPPLPHILQPRLFRDLEDFAGNLDHMYKEHGFFLPDSEHLADPEGLVKYLGLKVSVGHYPLYVRGDDPDGKQFRSLRATQQHMVDSNKCFMGEPCAGTIDWNLRHGGSHG